MSGELTSHSFTVTQRIRATIAVILILVFLSGCVSGGVFLRNGSDVRGNDTALTILAEADTIPGNYSIEFFYNTHCGACHVAMGYLNEYNAAHPDIIINSYDLFNSSENKALFEQYKKEYNRTYVAVPTIFIGNAGLEGESAIRENFDPLVTWYVKDRNTTANLSGTGTPKTAVQAHRTVISIPLVLIAGCIDGINPCASAVLVFLLIFLMTIRQKERVILAGAVFTSAVFFMYFLSGSGIFTITETSGIVKGVSIVAGVLAILAALMILGDAIIPGKGVGRIIPDSGRERISGVFRKLTLPAAFILGLILGVLELPCAGGIYITIIDMITFRVNIIQGLVYLVLYNLAFIVPLVLMTFIVFLVMRSQETQEQEPAPEKTRVMQIFTGMLLFVFAFLILSGVM